MSTAGNRAGIRPGTRSGLWSQFAYAISQLQPRIVVIENVRGLLSSPAHSDVEPCPICVGDNPDGSLRALGAVLGDLADLRFNAEWASVRASDVGACHARLRVFIVATAANTGSETVGLGAGLREGDDDGVQAPDLTLLPTPTAQAAKHAGTPDVNANAHGWNLWDLPHLLPTPQAHDAQGGKTRDQIDAMRERTGAGVKNLNEEVLLLPTPAVNDMGRGKSVEWWDEWAARQKAADGRPAPHGASLEIEALRLLPTPKASDGPKGWPGQRNNGKGVADSLPAITQLLPTPTARDHKGQSNVPGRTRDGRPRGEGDDLLPDAVNRDFGKYALAVHRWAVVLGRPAPPPTRSDTRSGKPRLNPAFVEWMMGLPEGWVTGIGLSHPQQLRILGNGVVPVQAAHALRLLTGGR